ncbi:MAG: sigma-70 family RNA polymerase sigma factor [Peptostreptococcaceae bacterium]|nr:sigma-70 family RNA polymerase sigma factor [Peptostreptococcaceae bacterium]
MISDAIEKYGDMVRRISFLYFRNTSDVDDVFQEVFLKFFQNYYSFKDEQHQKAWLCRVSFNKCKDLRKSFWRKKVTSIERIDKLEIPYESPEQGELLETVLELPPEYRKLIYLHYYEGWTAPEIADMLGININTVYTRLRRAKALLKKELGRA